MAKHTPLVALQGDIEKTDELLMSDEPDKPEHRKRKLKRKQGAAGSPAKTPGKPGMSCPLKGVAPKNTL